ncbi:hypothetical protein JCM8097_004036 [Rhodosporidiobolus ruineniae]
MPSYFCHECQNEFATDNDASPACPRCQSAFVEEIPPEDVADADDPRDFDPDDAEAFNPFLQFLGGGAHGGGGAVPGQARGGPGGAGAGAQIQFLTPGGQFAFTLGGNGQAQAGAGAAGGAALNPLTQAMLQAFGLAPPAQGFGAAGGQAQGEEAGDPEEQPAGGAEGGDGQGGRQQVPIQNLATFLGEAFGHHTPHPADDPSNNPFAEGGHERADEGEEQQPQQQAGTGLPGPFGSILNLLNAFGIGGGQFFGGGGVAGQAGDYVFGERNFQQLLNDLMEQAAGRAGPQPAPDDMIEKLPRVKISQELLEMDSITTCAICQDAYALSDPCIALPCKHIFHEDCLVPWLKTSGTCPTCRFALVPQPGQEGYGETSMREREQQNGGEQQPDQPAASTSSAAASADPAAPSSPPAVPSSTRPSLPTRQSSTAARALPPDVEGGSSLPGSWVWPAAADAASPSSVEEEEEVEEGEEGMDVDEVYGGGPGPVASGSGSGSGAGPEEEGKRPENAAAEAAERRAREERERRERGGGDEVYEEPVIEDVD